MYESVNIIQKRPHSYSFSFPIKITQPKIPQGADKRKIIGCRQVTVKTYNSYHKLMCTILSFMVKERGEYLIDSVLSKKAAGHFILQICNGNNFKVGSQWLTQ